MTITRLYNRGLMQMKYRYSFVFGFILLSAGIFWWALLKIQQTSKSIQKPLARSQPLSQLPLQLPLSAKSSCPAGFILVTGSSLYHTPDFCVMKYDAKCADVANPTVGLQPGLGSSCSGGMGGVA